jgi:hypothetical protein
MAKPTYHITPICTDIPANLSKRVGEIIIKWAAYECIIQSVVWALAGVDERIGRLAIREPRILDRIKMMEDLASLLGLEFDSAILKQMKATSNAIESRRDLFGHAPWVKTDDGFGVVSFRGKIADQTMINRSRKINPERIAVTPSALMEISDQLDIAIKLARSILAEVQRFSSSRKESP